MFLCVYVVGNFKFARRKFPFESSKVDRALVYGNLTLESDGEKLLFFDLN